MCPNSVASRRPENKTVLTTQDIATFHEGRALEFAWADEPPKSLAKVGRYRHVAPESRPVPEADALDLAVELALHYRDHHLDCRPGESRAQVCRCTRFDPAGEPFLRRLHAEIYSALSEGGLHDLFHALETASGRRGLFARKEDPVAAVA